MIRLISVATRVCYRYVAKPILFSFKPDDVHNGLVRVGSKIQQLPLTLKIMSLSWRYRNPGVLRQEIAGVVYENPVGLSAGFDKNLQLPLLLRAVGFGFMIGGSVTSEPCAGNSRPWFYRLPKTKSLVVNAGLANDGIKVITQRIKAYPKGTFSHFPLSISVAKANSPKVVSDDEGIADYIAAIQAIISDRLSSMIEINISCPNTYGGEPFTTPQRLDALLTKVDEQRVSLPVYIKMPQDLDWSAFKELLEVIIQHEITGVTISNLAKNRHELSLADDLPASVPGNLSGKPTEEKSNDLIARTYKEYGDRLVIIGVGGIFSAEDAYRKIKLGASLVALVTGMIFEGPQVIGSINYELAKLVRRDGYTHISEAIGADNQRIS